MKKIICYSIGVECSTKDCKRHERVKVWNYRTRVTVEMQNGWLRNEHTGVIKCPEHVNEIDEVPDGEI